jgi:ATP-binding cassette subfamily B protein
VLQGVTFSTAAGKSVAIVGGSGAGKSTLAALLCRFYEPVSGRILFDGRDAAELPLSWLRSQIAYVPQEVLLFGGSIRDNIAFGKPGSTEEEIREAARMAHALEFIESQPDKFETTVGDRGAQLSGGQRQRIALARALLKNPKILVLDEATSALDPESEAHIQAALAELSHTRTLFIIAHRLSTVRQADQIVVIKGGIVVESGTHAELYAAHGTYWHLCEQ